MPPSIGYPRCGRSKPLRARAARISKCADSLRVVWNSFHRRPALYPVYACGVLLCPSCGGRRYRHKKPYILALEALGGSHLQQRYLAATFTLRAVAVSHAADEIKRLHEAFLRLCRREPLKHAAYFRATQLNCAADGNVNPHIHSLFILPPGSGSVPISAEDWRSAAQLDYMPTVSIRWAYNPIGWMRYITAPPVKMPVDLEEAAQYLPELSRQLDGLRLFATGRSFPRKAPGKEVTRTSGARFQWAGGAYSACEQSLGARRSCLKLF